MDRAASQTSTIRQVTARNYNGDGISFQVCHDVRVEDCHSHDHADLGVHPGSGSQRPLILRIRLERNGIGLFWCWGVKYGLAEENRIDANRNYGISIGHNDTDNVMRHNEITRSGRVEILFRDESRGQDFVDRGGSEGIGIDNQGRTKNVRIVGNSIQETHEPQRRIGIRIAQEAGAVELAGNTIKGFETSVADQRKRAS